MIHIANYMSIIDRFSWMNCSSQGNSSLEGLRALALRARIYRSNCIKHGKCNRFRIKFYDAVYVRRRFVYARLPSDVSETQS